MAASLPLLLRSTILMVLALPLTISEPDYISSFCSSKGNYTTPSTYKQNLHALLSSMTSNAKVHKGFYNLTAGQDSDKVLGIFLCRAGVPSDVCRDCFKNSAQRIIQDCPNQKEAIIWYLECMLRYSNRSIFATMEDSPYSLRSDPESVPYTLKSIFNQALGNLLRSLVSRAVSGTGSVLMVAAGDDNYSSIQRVWAQVQCTPDISPSDCKLCLQKTVCAIPICCDGKLGGVLLKPSCNLRYAPGPFYGLTGLPPSPSATFLPPPPGADVTTTDGKGSVSSKIMIIIFVPTVGLLVLLSSICLFLRWMPKKRIDAMFYEDVDLIRSVKFLQFDFNTIRASTDDFSDANKLGEGGFGAVYKGMLPSGEQVAVKRLAKNSGQGDVEYKNEVVLLAKLYHKNLVRLLGFCLEGEEKLLIYEFMPNASLDHFIFDPEKSAKFDWERRYMIIGGISRGLIYLHEDSQLKIIHRDLKPGNILLDQDMNPKISDFGMARLFVVDDTQDKTKRVVGTYGYMAPEYARNGRYSVKTDVFSFGVLLLEIVSGKKNNSSFPSEQFENLLSLVWKKWREGMALDLIDPTLKGCYSRTEAMRCIQIGLLCVQENLAERPTMASVVLMINSDSFTLPLPSQPAFILYSEIDQSAMPSSECKVQSNEASISEIYPR